MASTGWRNNNALENSTRIIITVYTKVCSSRELSKSNEQAALVLAGRSCSLASVAKCAGHVEGHLASGEHLHQLRRLWLHPAPQRQSRLSVDSGV